MGGYNLPVQDGDSARVDAFGRQRASNPETLYECTFNYNLQPLLMEPVVSGGGSVVYDSQDVAAVLTTGASGTQSTIMQSFQFPRYQPGKSHLYERTFTFGAVGQGITKRVGIYDGQNGVIFENRNGKNYFRTLSTTTATSQEVCQAEWNGVAYNLLDLNTAQILVIDLQYLGVGRVRIGFSVNGNVMICHEFNNANRVSVPYMRTLVLPDRAELITVGVASTLKLFCSTIQSEGGRSQDYGFQQSISNTNNVLSGTNTALLSLRPRTTFNGITNRSTFILESIEILNGGSNPVEWGISVGVTFSSQPTYTDVNTTYSTMEYSSANGVMTGAPIGVIISGYVAAGQGQTKVTRGTNIQNLYPITLDASGLQRANGTLTGFAKGIGGASNGCRMILNWREVR